MYVYITYVSIHLSSIYLFIFLFMFSQIKVRILFHVYTMEFKFFPTFSPIAFPYSVHLHLPQSIPLHCPCPWVLYSCSFACPFPFFPLLSSSSTPLVTVSLFFISKSLALFSSFVCLLTYTYRWDYMVFFFHCLLISLSIMLSSSIHVVLKGTSPFFVLQTIPLCKCTTVFWSIHLLRGIWLFPELDYCK